MRIEMQMLSLLPFLPQPVRHVQKPHILHCLDGTGTSETEVWDGTCLRLVQPHRFLQERGHPLPHLFQAKGCAHTSTAGLSHVLSALRVVEKLRQYGSIEPRLGCLIA